MTTLPPSDPVSNVIQLQISKKKVEIRRQSQDRKDPLARLEAELVIRTSALKMENDELRGRIETLERCLRIITDNLQTAREMMDRLDIGPK